jgi:amidophosphoribosyltransferase
MKTGDPIAGVIKAAQELVGAFSMVIIASDGKLIAVRDGSGFRPLCVGVNEYGVAFASESCALDGCGFEFVRDLLPGEVVVAEKGEITYEQVEITPKVEDSGLCIFEYVYFSRPDSTLDNLNVFHARYKMGQRLAQEYPVEADVVCGVPDSGLVAAMGYAEKSGLPYVSGFVKNRYIGRSFIFPTQIERESAVRLKLNPLKSEVQGKRVVLVDDSIVRGTTSARIVRMLKNAGAREVHVRVSSPPFRYTCHFGTDIGKESNLIANKIDVDKIADEINADSLGYISIEGLKASCAGCALPFCVKCFEGNGDIKSHQKNEL